MDDKHPDEDLITDAVNAVDNVPPVRRATARSYIEAQIADYRAACRLANGPVAERSEHWKLRQAELHRSLRHFVAENPNKNLKPKECRGK